MRRKTFRDRVIIFYEKWIAYISKLRLVLLIYCQQIFKKSISDCCVFETFSPKDSFMQDIFVQVWLHSRTMHLLFRVCIIFLNLSQSNKGLMNLSLNLTNSTFWKFFLVSKTSAWTSTISIKRHYNGYLKYLLSFLPFSDLGSSFVVIVLDNCLKETMAADC